MRDWEGKCPPVDITPPRAYYLCVRTKTKLISAVIFIVLAAVWGENADVVSVFGEQICRRLHLPPDCLRDVKIEYVHSREELARRGGQVPEWGVGVAIPSQNRILIFKSGGPDKVGRVLRHELGHIALRKKVGDIYLPRWFDEGVAEYLAGGTTFSQQIRLAWAVLLRKVLSLQALEQVYTFNSDYAHLAYSESADAVEFLSTFAPIGNVCDSVAKYRDFAEGFRRGCGMSVYEFYRQWLRHLRRKYFALLLVGDSRFLWGMVALFIITFGMWKFLRQRRYMAQLHRQAEEEGWTEPPDI